jgi:hypothetical protein
MIICMTILVARETKKTEEKEKRVGVKRIPIEDFFRNPQKKGYKISPEGRFFAFRDPVKGIMNLFIKEIGGKEPVQLKMSSKMKYTKGERLNIHFSSKIRLEFHGARLTSDGGLPAYLELDEALGLFESASAVMNDRRTGRNTQHNITNLLRQSVYSRLAGYEDVNDAQRLSVDPVMRAIAGKKKNAASINAIGRFETKVLTLKEDLDSLSKINGSWIQKAMEKTPHHRVILDMNNSESPVHGEQGDSAYNGHFGCNCYHPLFCFNQYGDCEGAMLRSGNVHSADRWKDLLEPIIR